MPKENAVKPTYAELEMRCEQYRMAAALNHDTVIAQQIEYNRYISQLQRKLFDALDKLKRRYSR